MQLTAIDSSWVNAMQIHFGETENATGKQQKGWVDEQPNRSCTDQLVQLRIITEPSVSIIERYSPLYIGFVGNEKASGTIDRIQLWDLLNHYWVPQMIIELIKATQGREMQMYSWK